MTSDNPTTVHFTFDRETPGTMRYQEVDEQGKPKKASNGAVVGTLYVRKSALGKDAPRRLLVTIAAK
jgi:hypothetical protein